MKKTLPLLALAASLTLAACDGASHTIVDNGPADPMAAELANAAPVELPPSIAASKSYRCSDNSVLYIDWLSNGAARVKQQASDPTGTEVPAGSADILTGDAKAASITYQGKTCKG